MLKLLMNQSDQLICCRFSIRANYKNGRQSDNSNSMEIQLIENIKAPVVVPFIKQAYWIKPNAIEIYWTVSSFI